jgi:hypothetical protein
MQRETSMLCFHPQLVFQGLHAKTEVHLLVDPQVLTYTVIVAVLS